VIRQICLKDWRLLWPMVALATGIQLALGWASYKAGLFHDDSAAFALLRPLTIAWFAAIVALGATTVHQDPIPGVDQDWLIRPLKRNQVLLAKIVFVVVTVCAPMLLIDVALAMLQGFSFAHSLGSGAYKELSVALYVILPALALAALTRNMAELALLAAALVVAYAASLFVSALLLGGAQCPTCDTSVVWIERLLQRLGIVTGAGVILALQYYRRRTNWARAVALCGAVALVCAQLPWSTAFGIQRWISGSSARSAAVQIGLQAQSSLGAEGADDAAHRLGAGQATRALLEGNVGEAAEFVRERTHARAAPLLIDVPLRISGVSADELLLLDRLGVQVLDAAGRRLYRGTSASELRDMVGAFTGISPAERGIAHQTLELPAAVFRAHPRGAQVQLEYSLTLIRALAQHRMPAQDGTLKASDIGICMTRADQNRVRLRCEQLGDAPYCLAATLHGAHGILVPEQLSCVHDYRRDIPSPTTTLALEGIDLWIRETTGLTHGAAEPADFSESYVTLTTYGAPEHFTRKLVLPALRLTP
jgi:hypothetical protein